jgi:hypothetical protein
VAVLGVRGTLASELCTADPLSCLLDLFDGAQLTSVICWERFFVAAAEQV